MEKVGISDESGVTQTSYYYDYSEDRLKPRWKENRVKPFFDGQLTRCIKLSCTFSLYTYDVYPLVVPSTVYKNYPENSP